VLTGAMVPYGVRQLRWSLQPRQRALVRTVAPGRVYIAMNGKSFRGMTCARTARRACSTRLSA
jgi:hypothetical protein